MTEKLTKQEASKLIAEKVEQASALIKECEDIADKSGVSFSLDIGGYGMGGWYEPRTLDENGKVVDEWASSEGWQASSQSC